MVKSIYSQSRHNLKIEFEYYLSTLSNTIKDFLKYSPYYNDKLTLQNIYISCLLTLLNQVTLSNPNKKRMQNRLESMYNIEDFINKIYIEEQQDSIILFHLNACFKNYISTLVNEIKILMVKDLKHLIGGSEPTEAVMQAIMQSVKEGISTSDQE